MIANRTGTLRSDAGTTDDLRLLIYARHMANTALAEPARRMFELFLEQERERLCPDNGKKAGPADGTETTRGVGQGAGLDRTLPHGLPFGTQALQARVAAHGDGDGRV